MQEPSSRWSSCELVHGSMFGSVALIHCNNAHVRRGHRHGWQTAAVETPVRQTGSTLCCTRRTVVHGRRHHQQPHAPQLPKTEIGPRDYQITPTSRLPRGGRQMDQMRMARMPNHKNALNRWAPTQLSWEPGNRQISRGLTGQVLGEMNPAWQ